MVWNDDSQISWLVRSKSYTMYKPGETVIYVAQIDADKQDYEALLGHINREIRIEDAV